MTYTISIIKLVAFLDLLAVGLIVPLIPNHVRQMGGNQLYIGLLGSMYSGFQLGSGPLIGSLSDLKGCRNILIYTLFICSTAYVALGLTTSVIVIIILRAILGLFKQTQLLTKALVPEYEKDEKKQSVIFGKMAAISGMGMTLGPVIGGHIAEDFPENGFFYISLIVATVFIVNAGCVNMLPKTSIKINKNAVKKNPEHNFLQLIYSNSKQSVEELAKVEWSQYWDVFMFKALLGFSMGVYYSNYALYLKSQYDLTPKHVGYVISLQGLCLSYNIFIYTIWLVPMSIGNAVGRLVTLEMILRKKDQEHKGTLIGASNSIASLSGVLSPMVSGLIGHYMGVKYVIYASLASNVLALVLSYRYKTRHEKVE
ncbi:unnamed protein product [Colias eurytheme]|nr:unnamed protein product [Colias eurytheme]